MDTVDTIGKWFWALCMLFTFLNGAIFWLRARKRIELHPNLEEGYKKIIKGFVIWGNIPWIVMGIGSTIGGLPSVWHYFNPRGGNPYVLAFFASVFLIWIMGSYWIFLKRGAEALVDHPGLFNSDLKSPTMVKLIWLGCILGGLFGVFSMYMENIPIP